MLMQLDSVRRGLTNKSKIVLDWARNAKVPRPFYFHSDIIITGHSAPTPKLRFIPSYVQLRLQELRDILACPRLDLASLFVSATNTRFVDPVARRATFCSFHPSHGDLWIAQNKLSSRPWALHWTS